MSGGIETSGNRGIGPFPAEWGHPEGGAFSAERAAWVKAAVLRHMANVEVRKAFETSPAQARVELLRKRLAWLRHEEA